MSGSSRAARPRRVQYAALPYRLSGKSRTEVMLVTSRNTGRWIIPKGWPKKHEFAFYVQHFPTVEINATFYRLPTLKMVRGWRERSPRDFIFAVKGSRYLTHIRRLRDTGKGLRK